MLVDSFFFNVMSQEDAPAGRIQLGGIDGDQIDIRWENPIALQKQWNDIETLLRKFCTCWADVPLAAPTKPTS